MSLTDDLALVTACRDTLGKTTPGPWSLALAANPHDAAVIAAAPTVYGAALSLLEDTLNRHRAYLSTPSRGCSLCGATARFEATALGTLLLNESNHWPCESYNGALAALHTIAAALGVEIPA